MKLSFKHRFEAAHRFLSSSSKCATPHGHTWWVTLTLEHNTSAISKESQFAVDFKELKQEWVHFIDEHLDHHFFLHNQDPLAPILREIHPKARLKLTPGNPTTEVLSALILKKALSLFKGFSNICPTQLHLQETPTNGVTISAGEALEMISSFNTKGLHIWWT